MKGSGRGNGNSWTRKTTRACALCWKLAGCLRVFT